jgi:hypothetical protein
MEGVQAAMTTTRNLEQNQWRNREEWRLVSGKRRQLLKNRTDRIGNLIETLPVADVGEIKTSQKAFQRKPREDLGTGIKDAEGKQLAHDTILWCGLSRCLSNSPL